MDSTVAIAGIDVSKDKLDVHLLPSKSCLERQPRLSRPDQVGSMAA